KVLTKSVDSDAAKISSDSGMIDNEGLNCDCPPNGVPKGLDEYFSNISNLNEYYKKCNN
ncbi:MAG: hypothetical protein MHPSP_003014, partial [Paramarteilia canceri]